MEQILRTHAANYPKIGPADGVKLLYQAHFGGGHLIADPRQSLERLNTEYASIPHGPGPLWEDIGRGFVRVHLAPLDAASLADLNRDFVASARRIQGNMTDFLADLDLLRELTLAGVFGFSAEELENYLKEYLAQGCPPVSHSETYRAAYSPAYRVVSRRHSRVILLDEISRLARTKRVLVALDGRCASGKSTLAAQWAQRFGWSVVHMDHFFLRPEQRTPERLAQPGGNIDHERFLDEVLRPLSQGDLPAYRPFRCGDMTLGAPIRIEDSPVVLVEGSYSCHPELWDHYDLHVFSDVEPEEQIARIVRRDGADYAEVFRSRWIPLEEAYISAFDLANRCPFCLGG